MNPRQLLGQHFLRDKEIISRIVAAASLSKRDFVVEIGPGHGELTLPLLEEGCRVLAIEKDRRLADVLRQKVKNSRFKIIIDNALFRLPALALPTGWKLVANLPYQITAPILHLILRGDKKGCPTPPSSAVLMIQKEVMERLTAVPGDGRRGLLTVLAEACASKIEVLELIPKAAFTPPPKVESAIVRLAGVSRRSPTKDLDFLENLLKAGFAHKRQMLKNSLAFSWGVPAKKTEEMLNLAKVSSRLRAEDLSLSDWRKIQGLWQNLSKSDKLYKKGGQKNENIN